MKKSNTIIKVPTKVDGDRLILYGMGKFSDEATRLTKVQAMLLYADLHNFIKGLEKK